MDALHHARKALGGAHVADCMVMIVEQGCDPRDETAFARVVVEAIPEDSLGDFGCECGMTVATPRGDEVDLIVDEPVFVALLAAIGGVGASGESLDALRHDGRILAGDRWQRQSPAR